MSADPSAFHCLTVIPARYASTRFPGKPLHLLAGKPLLQHVWERCLEARAAAGVIIATDDDRIAAAARGFGAAVAMTRADHPSGTDRLAEVAAAHPEATHFLNVQGDEPLISPALLDRLMAALRDDPALPMITAASPFGPAAAGATALDPDDPNVVKVVLTTAGDALYFSRSRLPYARHPTVLPYYRHLGVYGYHRDFLQRFVAWPPSPLERTEALEQLRALENGARLRVLLTKEESPGVDTPAQAAEVERRLLGLSAGAGPAT